MCEELSVEKDGTREWRKNGLYHRDDGPAIEMQDGRKEWWRNGKLHREDGPAIEYPSGTKMWYREGDLHREGGPAIEYADGEKEWRVNGNLHREDGPAVEWADGDKAWYYKNLFFGQGDAPDPVLWERVTSIEANGGPLLNGCIVDSEGNEYWYKNDRLHREDGPAVRRAKGNFKWFFEGREVGNFWGLWELLEEEQRGNPNLLKWLPL